MLLLVKEQRQTELFPSWLPTCISLCREEPDRLHFLTASTAAATTNTNPNPNHHPEAFQSDSTRHGPNESLSLLSQRLSARFVARGALQDPPALSRPRAQRTCWTWSTCADWQRSTRRSGPAPMPRRSWLGPATAHSLQPVCGPPDFSSPRGWAESTRGSPS
ncbi:hypothetical protein CCMA1212_000772 [Trichoderma ghanense]|uniref:Uncharacterized protein n=1 Tax=Trichoderma ghanense TaxID=65468 RepID=A0ABY2HHK4_9HYPO